MPVVETREYRAMALPLGITETNKRFDTEFYVEGYATTFDDPYLLYEYDGVKVYEQISRNALDGADISDVIMQYDHAGKVLARMSNKTLGIVPDQKGLFIYADLSKSRAAQDMHEEIINGLATRMSWAFVVAKDSYDRTTRTRTIEKIKKVYDVSVVSIPANPGTEIAARSYAQGRLEAERRETMECRIQILLLKTKLEG